MPHAAAPAPGTRGPSPLRHAPLLTLLVIAAGTDYAIFLLGRYHEARHAGEDRETAYHTMYRSTAHVILGSGLTIAGAVFCLTFTRLPYFQSMGPVGAIGVLVALTAALTLTPAVVSVAGAAAGGSASFSSASRLSCPTSTSPTPLHQ